MVDLFSSIGHSLTNSFSPSSWGSSWRYFLFSQTSYCARIHHEAKRSSARSISIKKKADRIRLLRAPARIARRSMKSRLSHGLFRGPPREIRHKACRGEGGTGVLPKEFSRNNERKNVARPTGFNDALLSVVIKKPICSVVFSFLIFISFFLEGYISMTRAAKNYWGCI